MTSGGNFEGLPDIIKKLTESPEIADIIKNAGLAQSETPKDEPKSESASEGFNLSPEMMAKLPSVISMLQGMGIGSNPAPSQAEQGERSVDMNEIAAKLPQAMSALSSMGIGSGPHKSRGEHRKTPETIAVSGALKFVKDNGLSLGAVIRHVKTVFSRENRGIE